MSHKSSHIIARGGSFVFNRRVPKHAQQIFGQTTIRVSLGRCRDRAEVIGERLSRTLEQVWSSPRPEPIDLMLSLSVV
jgi:hypothetical protein